MIKLAFHVKLNPKLYLQHKFHHIALRRFLIEILVIITHRKLRFPILIQHGDYYLSFLYNLCTPHKAKKNHCTHWVENLSTCAAMCSTLWHMLHHMSPSISMGSMGWAEVVLDKDWYCMPVHWWYTLWTKLNWKHCTFKAQWVWFVCLLTYLHQNIFKVW